MVSGMEKVGSAAGSQPVLRGSTFQSIGFMGNTNKSSKRNQIWLF